MTRLVLRFDERVGVRLLRNVQTRSRLGTTPYLMRTNGEGFRTAELSSRRPEGKRRVLVYGDSFTEGVGVSDGHRFTDVLETLVPDVEVLNFGVRATGTDQQLLYFRERPNDLEYDLVVIGLYTGDVLRNHSKYGVLTSDSGEHFEKPYFRSENGELVLHNVPVPRVARAYDTLDKHEQELVYYRGVKYRLRVAVRRWFPWAKTALQRLTRYQPAPYLASPDSPAWLLTRAIVEQWAAESSAPVVVLAIPPYQYVEKTASPAAYKDRFAELAASPNLQVHDPLPELVAASGAEALRIPGDAHYSAEGHRVIAESLAPLIAAALSDITTPQGTEPQ
jgi:lysophospholipase L1-like esterase